MHQNPHISSFTSCISHRCNCNCHEPAEPPAFLGRWPRLSYTWTINVSWILKKKLTCRCCARSRSHWFRVLGLNSLLRLEKRPLNALYNDKEESKCIYLSSSISLNRISSSRRAESSKCSQKAGWGKYASLPLFRYTGRISTSWAGVHVRMLGCM
jgi:hypothetical protein